MFYSVLLVSGIQQSSSVIHTHFRSGIPTDWKWEDEKKYSMPMEIKRASTRVAIHISDKKGNINSEEFSSFSSLENNEKKKKKPNYSWVIIGWECQRNRLLKNLNCLTIAWRKSHGWRSLVGCSPWGLEESDTTKRLLFHFSLSCIGEVNGNPLQYSCLENPRDGGAWWAAIYGVKRSRTQLKQLSSSSSSMNYLASKCIWFWK